MGTRERALAACIATLLVFGLVAAAVAGDAGEPEAAARTTTTERHDDGSSSTSGFTGTVVGETTSTPPTSAADASTTATTAGPGAATATTTAPTASTEVPAPSTPPTSGATGTANLAVYSRISVGGDGTRRLRILVDNAGPAAGGPITLQIDPGIGLQLLFESSTPGLTCTGAGPFVCTQGDSPVGGRIVDVTFTVGTGGSCPQGQPSHDVALDVSGSTADPEPANNEETRSACRLG